MATLERRLQLGLSLSVLSLIVTLGLLLFASNRQIAHQLIENRLQHDSDSLLSALLFDQAGKASLNPERLSGIYSQPLSGHYYTILIEGGDRFYSRSLWDTSLQITPLPPGELRSATVDGPQHASLLQLSGGYLKQGHKLTIAVAEDLSQVVAHLQHYTITLAAICLFVLGLMLIWQRLIVRRSLRPLEQMRVEIRKLDEGAVETLSGEVPGEIRPLVDEINRLLALVRRRLIRSRGALGNLAHALKGPLNLLHQLASGDALKGVPEVGSELLEHSARLHQVIEHELRRARLAGSGLPGKRFFAESELPVLRDLLQRIYRDKDLQIEIIAPQGTFGNTDHDDMLELLGNLLDNACKWAASRIRCTLAQGERLTISVEDDGPGCSEEQISLLLQRGSRLDESVPGHGLGLAIVNDITTLYHGRIELSRSQALGGLQVEITLNEMDSHG